MSIQSDGVLLKGRGNGVCRHTEVHSSKAEGTVCADTQRYTAARQREWCVQTHEDRIVCADSQRCKHTEARSSKTEGTVCANAWRGGHTAARHLQRTFHLTLG